MLDDTRDLETRKARGARSTRLHGTESPRPRAAPGQIGDRETGSASVGTPTGQKIRFCAGDAQKWGPC